MSSVDGFLDTVITTEPQPIPEVVATVVEAIDAAIQACPDMIPIFLADGLCAYDEDDRTWYARGNTAIRERLYELALHGEVGMTKTDVWWVPQ